MLLSHFLKKSIIPSLKKRKTFAYLHMIFKFLYNSTGARTSTILHLHLPASTYHSLPMQTQFTLATLSYLPLFPEEDLDLHISYYLPISFLVLPTPRCLRQLVFPLQRLLRSLQTEFTAPVYVLPLHLVHTLKTNTALRIICFCIWI